MVKQDAIDLINEKLKQKLELHDQIMWSWLRAVIEQIPSDDWELYLERALAKLAA